MSTKETILYQIGKRAAKRRVELGLTQKDISKLVGYKSSDQAVYNFENGRADISISRLYQFAEVLQCNLSYLLGIETELPHTEAVIDEKMSDKEKKLARTALELLDLYEQQKELEKRIEDTKIRLKNAALPEKGGVRTSKKDK